MSFGFTSTDVLFIIGFALLIASITIPLIYNVLRHMDEVFRKDDTSFLKDRKIPIYGTTVILITLISIISLNIFATAKGYF